MSKSLRLWVCAGVLLTMVLGMGASRGLADETQKPTEYPKTDAEWPGKGVIRKFGWMVDNRNYFWTRRQQDQNAIIFVGDSLTGGWKSLDKDFAAYKVANRGIGGDVSRGVLFRFKEDVLDLHPRAVVLLVGINDLTARGSADDAIANIQAVITMAHQQDWAMPIILCTVPPSAHPQAPVDEAVRRDLNNRLRQLATTTERVQLCDLFAAMSNPDGSIRPEFFGKDQLHFGEAGYRKWTELLTPIFEKLGLK